MTIARFANGKYATPGDRRGDAGEVGYLYESSLGPRPAGMRIKNVNQMFSWMIEMFTGSDLNEAMMLDQVGHLLLAKAHGERG